MNLHKLDYLILTLCELFIFGYVGNWMKIQSTRVSDAIYRCPWYLCGGPFRRTVVMFMANSMRPVVLTGGGFFILDYEKAKGVWWSIDFIECWVWLTRISFVCRFWAQLSHITRCCGNWARLLHAMQRLFFYMNPMTKDNYRCDIEGRCEKRDEVEFRLEVLLV